MYVDVWLSVALCLSLIFCLAAYLDQHLVVGKKGWLKRSRVAGEWVLIRRNISFVDNRVSGIYPPSSLCSWDNEYCGIQLYNQRLRLDFTVALESVGDGSYHYGNPEDATRLLSRMAIVWADTRSCLGGELSEEDEELWKNILVDRLTTYAGLNGYKLRKATWRIYGDGLEREISGSHQ